MGGTCEAWTDQKANARKIKKKKGNKSKMSISAYL